MAKLKIKPKDFEKRQKQSKTFKDWNDENGKSSSYVGTRKRKATVIDECEAQFKSPTLNKNTRINGSENIGELIYKISDGHIGASVALFHVYTVAGVGLAVNCMLNLDALGYYGTKVFEIWDIVDKDPVQFIDYVSGVLHGDN